MSTKHCTKCDLPRLTTDFAKTASTKDGYCTACKHCNKAYRLKNKERIAQYKIEWAKENKEHLQLYKKGYRVANKESVAAGIMEWKQSNKERVYSYEVKRRDLVSNYNMTELDQFALEEAYLLCKDREGATGVQWHVDHIVPVQHDKACGLNSAANLQVVPASWNLRKGNKSMLEYTQGSL